MEPLKHFLYPSTIFVSKEPALIDTILGSCVAVCLYDTYLKYGGMNHYMLPYWNGQGLASPKFGNIAITKLIEKMKGCGSLQKNLIAKVFGGANVIETNNIQFMIGERNIAIALDMLHELQIQVVSQSMGGSLGRKIQFNSGTGEVRQRIIERQKQTLIDAPVSGEFISKNT